MNMAIDDPEKLGEVDQQIRINELKEQVREVTGEEVTSFESEDAPPEIVEQFWQNVLDSERGPWTTGRKQLQRDGVALPPAAELTDAQLAAKLDEIFARLADNHTHYLNTDHLSDRELYELLLTDSLNEEFPETPPGLEGGVFIVDLTSSGSEQDTLAHFRYYATEEDRQDWLKDFPDYEMPPHEDPPYDRDSRMPPRPEGI